MLLAKWNIHGRPSRRQAEPSLAFSAECPIRCVHFVLEINKIFMSISLQLTRSGEKGYKARELETLNCSLLTGTRARLVFVNNSLAIFFFYFSVCVLPLTLGPVLLPPPHRLFSAKYVQSRCINIPPWVFRRNKSSFHSMQKEREREREKFNIHKNIKH